MHSTRTSGTTRLFFFSRKKDTGMGSLCGKTMLFSPSSGLTETKEVKHLGHRYTLQQDNQIRPCHISIKTLPPHLSSLLTKYLAPRWMMQSGLAPQRRG